MKSLILAAFLLLAAATGRAVDATLWEIGKPDHNTAKFALGPAGYKSYRQPAMFVVGHSDPRSDWPYVQPGVVDGGWAPGTPQTFEVLFALAAAPREKSTLELHFADTHSQAPPQLRVEINELAKNFQTPPGGGDASVFGQPDKGRPCTICLEAPAGTLKAGLNRVAVTTLTGSWVLWDAVRFVAPADTRLTAVEDFVVPSPGQHVEQLVWHDGQAVQPVALRIFHAGTASEADVRIGNRPPQRIHLHSGLQDVECLAPPVEKNETLPVALSVGSGSPLRSEVSLRPVRKWEVYILMHSHNDIGYTDIQPNIAKKQAHNVVRALELIEKTKDYPPGARFKWNLEVLMPYEDFRPVATAEQMRQFERAVRDGFIGVDAMYANLLTGVCRGEELLRQFTFATALGRRCGVKVDSMSISDVPGLTWGVVPALAQNGVKYISDGPNYLDRIGYARVTWEDKPFWWVGPDGHEKVLYWAPYFGYAFGHTIDHVTDAVQTDLRHLVAEHYPYDIVQMRWSKGDNGLPDERVMDEVRQWNARHAYPRLIIATTSEMFHAFQERYGDKLPTFRGDFTPYWEDGAASGAAETAINRHTADRLSQAETLWALRGAGPYPASDFAAAWKNVALWSEHTWGAYNSISEPNLPFVKTQWKFKQAWALDAQRQSRKLMAQALGAGAGDSGGKPSEFDVFNTSSWPRTGLVKLPKRIEGNSVCDQQGRPVPSQRLSGGELAFLASDVPPLGAKRYTVEAAAPAGGDAHAGGNSLTTPLLSVKVNETTGAIASLKRAGIDVELAAGPINGYAYLPGGNVKDAKPNGTAKVVVKEKGPLVASLAIESDAPGCRKLVREVRVIDGLDRVELIDTVDKLPVRAIEGVHFGFSFNVPNPEVRINSAYAVTRPEKDQIPGACKNWFSVERWVDVSNDRYGMTWVTADAPLVELGGLTANLPREQPNPNAYLKHIQPSAALYSWALNNHWETNYRADQEGVVRFHYYLHPHAAYDAAAAARFGIETTEPLVAVAAAGPQPLASRLRVEPADVLVTALKPSDDGKAMIVRLYGASGQARQARLTWSDPRPSSLRLSDASEQPGAEAGDSVEVPGWGIVTLRAETGSR